jgi:hypothetical protein
LPKTTALELDDPYFWLRDDTRKNPEVLGLIKEENQYTAIFTRHSKPFQQQIYKDLLRHLKQTDASVPYPWEGIFYYSRTVEGKSYSYICRRRGSMDAPEDTILDLNALAKREKYLDVGEWSPAPGAHALLAYSVDTTGYEVCWREGGREGGRARKRKGWHGGVTTALSLTHFTHTHTPKTDVRNSVQGPASRPGRGRRSHKRGRHRRCRRWSQGSDPREQRELCVGE